MLHRLAKPAALKAITPLLISSLLRCLHIPTWACLVGTVCHTLKFICSVNTYEQNRDAYLFCFINNSFPLIVLSFSPKLWTKGFILH